MNPEYQARKKSHILYDADVLDQIDDGFFDPALWSARGKLTGTALGRGTTVFIRDGEQHWVLRHYLRGGMAAQVSRDRYLWAGLEQTRAWREWHLLAELQRRGLPVPPPVAVRVERYGLLYTADIVTGRIDGRALSVLAREQPLAPEQWKAVGECIRRFHDEGVFHADLNAHNILVEGDSVSLLDFDRGRLREPGKWQGQNLERLLRSLRKLAGMHFGFNFDDEQWQLLLSGYRSA
jgi:3-deoxy-D-manno-octulosonic acid kinase